MDGNMCQQALRVASTETKISLLRGLVAGAISTAARMQGHMLQDTTSCLHCDFPHKDEAHATWDCVVGEDAWVEWWHWVLRWGH